VRASLRQHKHPLPGSRTHGAACERGCVPARRVKLAAVYLSMTLLCLIFAVLIVRGVLALVTWVALGRCLWLFPFLLSEARRGAPSLCCRPKDQLGLSEVPRRQRRIHNNQSPLPDLTCPAQTSCG